MHDVKKKIRGDDRRGRDMVYSGPTPWCGVLEEHHNCNGPPEEWRVGDPHWAPPPWGTYTRKRNPVPSDFKIQCNLHPGEAKTVGNQDYSLKGPPQKFIHSKSQRRACSLKSIWVIHEGDTLTDFQVCARGAGVCWNFLQQWRTPFSFGLLCFIILPPSLPSTDEHQFWYPPLTC